MSQASCRCGSCRGTRYSKGSSLPLLFWLAWAWQTLTRVRLSGLFPALRSKESLNVEGLSNIPADGSFVLAANHYVHGSLLNILAAVIQAAGKARPDSLDTMMIVAGKRDVPPGGSILFRLKRRFFEWVLRRWRRNIITIPLANERPSISALREWRERVRSQPVVVLPEGKAGVHFAMVRPGCGRWLGSFGAPVIPVGVWFKDGTWYVRFGSPMKWATQTTLLDKQLGIAIAGLLPPDLAPSWQPILARLQALSSGSPPPQLAMPRSDECTCS